jgi:hypothetical protein
MNRDSHLIFESYRKKVVINEAAALALPIMVGLKEILGATMGVAATGVLLDKLDNALNTLTLQEKQTLEGKFQKIVSISSSRDTSIRNQYELLNTQAQINKDPELDVIINGFKTFLKTYSYFTQEMAITGEIASSTIQELIGLNQQLVNFTTRKGKGDKSQGQIATEGLVGISRQLLDMLRESKGGGGGGNNKEPQDPKKGKGFGATLSALWDKISTMTWKHLLFINAAIVLIVPQFLGFVTSRYKEGGEAALEGLGIDTKTPKPEASPTPKPKPETKPTPQPLPVLPRTAVLPNATPDPYSYP